MLSILTQFPFWKISALDSCIRELETDLSIGFQSSFSKTWYLEEVLVNVP